jgi:hypothetical protein
VTRFPKDSSQAKILTKIHLINSKIQMQSFSIKLKTFLRMVTNLALKAAINRTIQILTPIKIFQQYQSRKSKLILNNKNKNKNWFMKIWYLGRK